MGPLAAKKLQNPPRHRSSVTNAEACSKLDLVRGASAGTRTEFFDRYE
eukprot:CAMPEP_0185789236 /NCGR_PEP_ID=MMETSP1174-20130828/149972_1 /TAXON_ID=35687 /ORGANISM="Dictyocha speculum, Strain CCMP1381" /LENGTH=47 /DNA_ID= /DNA_START= /DNA_END= /DNA_ORIENTATION=